MGGEFSATDFFNLQFQAASFSSSCEEDFSGPNSILDAAFFYSKPNIFGPYQELLELQELLEHAIPPTLGARREGSQDF